MTLIVFPPVLLVGSIILFPIFSFIFISIATRDVSGGISGAMTAARMANILLGFLGMLGLGGLFTALPIGLYLFFSTPKSPITTEPPTAPPQA